jgi:hypothetical protein
LPWEATSITDYNEKRGSTRWSVRGVWIASWLIPLFAAVISDSDIVDRVLRATYVTDPPSDVLHFDYFFQRFYMMMSRPVLLATAAAGLALPLLPRLGRWWPSPNQPTIRASVPPSRTTADRVLSRSTRAAIAIVVLGIVLSILTGKFVLRDFANSADEWAYQFQANTFLQGTSYRDATEDPLIPQLGTTYFVVVKDSKWFAMTFPGWPALLAVGRLLGVGAFVNPLLAGIALWFTYLVAREVLGERSALLVGVLIVTSPFFLLNSASYFSQPTTLACTAGALYLVLRGIKSRSWQFSMLSGILIGLAFTTRPFTALAIGIPIVAALATVGTRDTSRTERGLRAIGFGLGFLLPAIPWLLYNASITGDPLTTPYSWSGNKDVPGFFKDGYSVHTPLDGVVITAGHLLDLWAWMPFALLPFAVVGWSRPRTWELKLLAAIPVAIVAAYWAYINYGGNQYGPRYYYEALPSLAILIVRGLDLSRESRRRVWGQDAIRRATAASIVLFGVGQIFAGLWFLSVHGKIVAQRQRPYELVAERRLENAVLLLETGAGTMELMDLVRNDPCCRSGVVWAPAPRFVMEVEGDVAASAYARGLERAYSGREIWSFRDRDPRERGPEWACVRWPIPPSEGELRRIFPR